MPHEIVRRLRRVDLHANGQRVAGMKNEGRLPLAVKKRDIGDLHIP